jgi:hypothetical protein
MLLLVALGGDRALLFAAAAVELLAALLLVTICKTTAAMHDSRHHVTWSDTVTPLDAAETAAAHTSVQLPKVSLLTLQWPS